MKLTPKNWDKFQHYKDRSPPWIKLHRDLLDNRNYWRLSPKSAKYLPLIWLISSEKDGAILDNEDLAFRLRIDSDESKAIVDELYELGFLVEFDTKPAQQGATNAQQLAAQNGFGSRHISDKTKRQVWERDHGECQNCKSTESIEYDHILPVSKGGNSDPSNLQLLCRPCNRSKRAKTAEQDATHGLSSRTLETETETETEERQKKPRATRLPADWTPSEDQIKYCRENRPDLNPLWVADNFRDYWVSKPKDNTKLDWNLTWQIWVRKETAPKVSQKPSGGSPSWLQARKA
jgi:hypothetical protein